MNNKTTAGQGCQYWWGEVVKRGREAVEWVGGVVVLAGIGRGHSLTACNTA